jgi:hypothetical protein
MGWNAIWDAHNVVRFGANKAIFEYVNDDLTSVSSKFIMFSDIAHLASGTISLNTIVISLDNRAKRKTSRRCFERNSILIIRFRISPIC